MAIVVMFEFPGMTQAKYELSGEKLTEGRGMVDKVSDWPVPGLISHTAGPTPDGWYVVDVWESEEAFRKFGAIIVPILRDLGAGEVEPKIYPVFKVVTT
ncbi:hypothetical protein [Streptomyces fructofermentans]|uniref:hypothetical protein n=1 Tax=Streptomyces fructofermentans TaxID=152141 RepID=UPI0033EE880B